MKFCKLLSLSKFVERFLLFQYFMYGIIILLTGHFVSDVLRIISQDISTGHPVSNVLRTISQGIPARHPVSNVLRTIS